MLTSTDTGRAAKGSPSSPHILKLSIECAGIFLFATILWLALLMFPQEAATHKLDPSWRAVLAHDYLNGLLAGVETVYTYGPFGYLLAPQAGYVAELYWARIIIEMIAKLIAVGSLLALATTIKKAWIRFAYLALLILLAPAMTDSIYFLTVAVLTVLILQAGRVPTTVMGLVLFFFAFLSLAKFTMLLFVFLCVIAVAVDIWQKKHAIAAASLIGVFGTMFLLLWLFVAGQTLSNLQDFFVNSLEIARGYNQSLSKEGSKFQILFALLVGALLMGQLGRYLSLTRRSPQRIAHILTALVVIVVLFVSWKAGFVRQDGGHVVNFFTIAASAPLMLYAGRRRITRSPTGFSVTSVGVIVLCLVGTFHAGSGFGYGAPDSLRTLRSRWARNARTLSNPAAQKMRHDARREQLKQKYALPRAKAEVGGGTVDNVTHSQGVLYLNDLSVRHRPAFQSCIAYTPRLQAMNGDFYSGDSAPDYVLLRIKTVDYWFPLVQDSETFKAILRFYKPELIEKGFCLFKKRRDPVHSDPHDSQTVLNERVDIGEWVDIPSLSAGVHELSLQVRPSITGRMRLFLFRLPNLYLEIKTEDSELHRYRISPCLVRSGFILNPLIRNNAEFISLYTGKTRPKISSFRVLSEKPRHYEKEVLVKVRHNTSLVPAEAVPLHDEIRAAAWKMRFSMLRNIPDRVFPDANVFADVEKGRSILLAHAPAEIHYELEPGSYRIRGQYGIRKGAYEEGAQTDGVSFDIHTVTKNGSEVERFHRHLDPAGNPADRGFQELRLRFRIKNPSLLVFRTETGPRQDSSWDWSFWRRLEIIPY